MPVVNIGPYGKDAHKLSERVYMSYSFDAHAYDLGTNKKKPPNESGIILNKQLGAHLS